jgi:hypothetical protein
MKNYFVIPDFYFHASLGRVQYLELTRFAIGGIETLTDAFKSERSFQLGKLSNAKDTYQFSTCNADMSSCSIKQEMNSYNPFYNDLGLDFANVGRVKRGAVTGIVSGSDYGAGVLTLGIDRQLINTGEGLQRGSFYIDIDETKDLDVRFTIHHQEGSKLYRRNIRIRYRVSTKETEFRLTSGTYKTQGDNYLSRGLGFLNGSLSKQNQSMLGAADEFLDFGVRSRSYALRVVVPVQPVVIDARECCYENVVFADDTEDEYQNDYTSFYHKKVSSSDSVDFVLIRNSTLAEVTLTGTTYGYPTVSTANNIVAYTVEWAKVLAAFGEDTYQIKKVVTISGIENTIYYNNYSLETFSEERADKTVRIDSVMNGYLEKDDANFKGMNLMSTLRMRGFFGRRRPKYTEDNIVYRDNEARQVSMIMENEYVFQSNAVPSCITKDLYEYYLMSDKIYLNDYNSNNHDTYIKKSVRLAESQDPTYYVNSKRSRVNLTFNDGVRNQIKRVY